MRGFELLEARLVLDAGPVISEFMAVNTRVLADQDGAFSDWIEIQNPSAAPVNLNGWHLTDDAAALQKWTFPAVTLDAGDQMIVFASGKNRRVPGSELHTSFQLDGAGEYLALVAPDGTTIATQFTPAYPPQRADVSYGTAQDVSGTPLVAAGGTAKVLVPHDDSLGQNWTGGAATEPFDDSLAAGWTAGPTGIGYDTAGGAPGSAPLPQAYWSFDDNVNDTSGNGHNGVLHGAVYSSAVPPALGTGKSLNFNGTSDYVGVPIDVSEQNYTVSMWFKADTTGHGLFSVVAPDLGANGSDRHLYLSGANLACRVWSNQTISTGGKNYVDGRWHNLVHQYGSEISGQRLYVDGQLVASGTKPSSDFNWQTHLDIGFSVDAASPYFDGLIDDVAVWDTVLTAAQIQALTQGASPMALAGYGDLIGTNVATAMKGVNASAYVRAAFTLQSPGDVETLRLRMKYDDGFVAYLNGQVVARRNAPESLDYNSPATADQPKNAAIQFENFDLPGAAAVLRSGTNILAIQGLNDQAGSSDFLVLPELVQVLRLPDRYMTAATPGQPNGAGILGFVADTHFSVDRGFFTSSFQLAIATDTPGAIIRYTTDGSVPTETTGTRYTAPLSISRTTTLRAAAFKTGYQPSVTDTQTYLFLTDVIQQPGMWTAITADPTWGPQMRDSLLAIPTVSVVTASTLSEAEVPTSIELIYPDGTQGFQVNAGIELYGGHSLANYLKKSMRVSFKGIYGPGMLKYDLFGNGATDEFDQILLRSGSHDAVFYENGTKGIYIRNRFTTDRQLEMGQPATHERFVHLYINGVYSGQYSLMERPTAAFMASYSGGNKEDYDAIHANGAAPPVPVDGDLTAWNAMVASAGNYQVLQQYMDVVNYADYMLLQFYCGNNWDWLPYQNWMAARKREAGAGFDFFCWDNDMILRRGPAATAIAGAISSGGPGAMWSAVSQNTEFRMLLADRAQKYFFNSGILTGTRVQADLEAIAHEMNKSIIAETARWGSAYSYTPATWRQQVDTVKNTIVPGRESIVIQQLRSAGVFPSINAPAFSQFGGLVPSGYALTMTGTGTVYYTLDGSDPRLAGGAVSPTALTYFAGNPPRINESRLVKARARSGGTWSALSEAQFYVYQPAAAGNCVVSEINYNPSPPTTAESDAGWTADDFEFLELRNTGSPPIDLTGAEFTAGIACTFAGGSAMVLMPGESGVVVRTPAAFEMRYGTSIRVIGQYTGRLDNGGEQLRLLDYLGQPIFDFTYSDAGAWPGRADGKGSTLELSDPAAVPAAETERTAYLEEGSHWRSSSMMLGTPGAANPDPLNDVVINEVLAHSDQPLVDAIELHNTTGSPVDIGGWWLSDTDADYEKFRIPDGTVIAAHSYVVFYEGHFSGDTLEFAVNGAGQYTEFGGGAKGFGLNGAHGDDVYLLETDGSGKLVRFADHVDFRAMAGGKSYGRWQDDQGNWRFYPVQQPTLGNANDVAGNGPSVGPVVISEVMYAPQGPLSGTETAAGFTTIEDLEFIEIYNPTSQAVDLARWQLDKGVAYAFAAGATMDAGKTLVIVPFDPANAAMLTAFRTRYGMNASLLVAGPYTGHLSNTSDKIGLLRPDIPPVDEPGFYPGLLEDEIVYDSAWGARGDGQSLTRVNVGAWGLDQASWAAVATSAGLVRRVAGRYVFYNNSAFDGRTAGAAAADDGAVAADKTALLPGQRAGFTNYTSFSRGINGIMVDIAGLPGTTLTAADFDFRTGNSDDLAAWSPASLPATIQVRALAGGVSRVTLIWADNVVADQWLQVTVKPTANTGIPLSDVFYFGSAIGETGDRSAGPDADAVVDASDELAVRANNTAAPAPVANSYDFNRDRRVNALDELLARNHYRQGASALQLIDLSLADVASAAAAVLKADEMAIQSEPRTSALTQTARPSNNDSPLRPPSGAAARSAWSRESGTRVGAVADQSYFTAPAPLARAAAHDAVLEWGWLWELERAVDKSSARKSARPNPESLARLLAMGHPGR